MFLVVLPISLTIINKICMGELFDYHIYVHNIYIYNIYIYIYIYICMYVYLKGHNLVISGCLEGESPHKQHVK